MIAVVLPAFNEASTIGDVLDRLPPQVSGTDLIPVVVDDGSTDGTGEIARSFGFTVVSSPVNRGKGHSLRLGMDAITGLGPEAIVWMDCDGQHIPEMLERLVTPILSGTADMVVGSRYRAGGGGQSAPLNRRIVRRAVIASIRWLTGAVTTDPFSGFRSFSPRAVSALVLQGDGYESELEATLTIAAAGMATAEVAIPRIYGPGTSKMGHRHGKLLGRLSVVRGYVWAILRGLHDRRKAARLDQRAHMEDRTEVEFGV